MLYCHYAIPKCILNTTNRRSVCKNLSMVGPELYNILYSIIYSLVGYKTIVLLKPCSVYQTLKALLISSAVYLFSRNDNT